MFESHYQLHKNAFWVVPKSIFLFFPQTFGVGFDLCRIRRYPAKLFIHFSYIDFTHLLQLCYNKKNCREIGVIKVASSTKRALADALKQMMEIKPIAKITVKDLVEICNVNRQTFYYHFDDV